MKNLPLVVCLLCLFSLTDCSTNTALLSSVEMAEKFGAKKKNNSLVIAFSKNGTQTVRVYGEGAGNKSVDENTLFDIGGLTQVFTASLMLKMGEEGILDPADCAKAYLPEGTKIPDFQPKKCVNLTIDPSMPDDVRGKDPIEITSCYPDPLARPECLSFCQLADHSSGLMEGYNAYEWYPFGEFYQKPNFKDGAISEFYENLFDVDFAFSPGVNYYYSPTGMALLGNVLGEISNKKYTDLVQEKLLLPLGLKSTTFNTPITGYNAKGKKVASWNFEAFAPAGGMQSTAADLLTFLEAQLDNEHAWSSVFSEAHLARKHTVHTKNSRTVTGAYAWLISPVVPGSDENVWWLNGGTAGARSFIGFNKSQGTAVVVLANSASDVDEIGFKILAENAGLKTTAASVPVTKK